MGRQTPFVIAFVAVLALVLLRFDASGGYQVYVPSGYIQEVERFARDGKLVYDCAAERIETKSLSDGESFFLRNSYLRRDLAAWNEDGDRRPFLVEREDKPGGGCEGELLGPNPSYHKQRLPGYKASRWRGSLYLQPGKEATVLTSSERSIEVIGTPRDLLPLPAKSFEDVGFRSDSPGARAQKLAFRVQPWDPTFAELKPIGGCGALEVKNSDPSLWLNGCELPLGLRVRLDAGDRLRVHQNGVVDDHFLVETGERAGLVSFAGTVNGELRRRTFTDRLVMAQDIAYAVDAAVRAGRPSPDEQAAADKDSQPDAGAATGRDDFNVHLTLDPFLDQRLQNALRDVSRQRYGKRPLRASMTVMNAADGRVLALASYPRPGDLDDLRLKSEGHRALLAQNHNFMTHPVGSAAKPFLATAALALRPELAELEVPCFPEGGEVPETLLGYPLSGYNLPGDCQGAAREGRVDLPRFLEVSSNRYMLYMGLLALADWQGGRPLEDPSADPLPVEQSYFLGSRRYGTRPQLSIFRSENGTDTILSEVAEEPYMQEYRDLFGQEVHFVRGSLVEALDLDPWQPVLDVAGVERRDRAVVAFSPVSAETVNLGGNLVQNLRRDLYTLLLGNGNNRWSNVQLAEAMARLVQGARIETRMIDRVTAPGPGETLDVLWSPEAETSEADLRAGDLNWRRVDRGPVIDGMRRVVENPTGTAFQIQLVLRELNKRTPDGVEYKALGKTGTPTLTPAAVKRSPTRIGPQAEKRFGKYSQVQSGVLVLAIERYGDGAEPETLTVAVHVDSQGGSNEAVAVAADLLVPLVESYWPEDWLRGR